MQTLHLLALDPIAETLAEPYSYGFRSKRSTADAIERCFGILARKYNPEWVLEADVNHYRLKAVASITLAKRINEMKSQNYLVCGAFLVLQYIFALVAHLDSPL